MRFARLLYRRYRELTAEAARFVTVGAVAFLVTVIGTNALHSGAGLGPLPANALANIVATCVAFAGNRHWTFRHRANSGQRREFTLFFLLNAAGLALQLVCIGFTRYALGFKGAIPLNLALITGIGLGTVFRFWSYRRWVFLAPVTALPVRPDRRPVPPDAL